MANNQMPLPQGEDDIIQQSEAYRMAGVTRAVLRGCIDRGELRVADHLGSRGSARLYRSDVARLMAERRWPGETVVLPAQAAGDDCRRCCGLEAENAQLRESNRRLRDALGAATA
ncbi:hypothetical protein ACQEV9_18105 [Streptomyces chartreusis]|uniref:hypothetical protein n=1 Tax=Streptomyces chartreusis TaxID=1969 RepID=UPI003D89F8F3